MRHHGDKGLSPGEVGPQLSELELSDSDSSVDSILSVCLDGFNGLAWITEIEGAQDDIQVGRAAGVNDPGDIPWRTTAWSAGADVVASAKGAKRVSGVHRQTISGLSEKEVSFEKGTVAGGNASEVGVPLTPHEKKAKKRHQDKTRRSPSSKKTVSSCTNADNRG